MTPWLDEFSGFLATARIEDMPAEVVDQAGWVVLDTLGAIAAGSQEPEMAAATGRLARSPGPCGVIGAAVRTTPQAAALLNGMAGTFLEMDEGNRFARGHPGIHAFTAAWALAEARGASGRALMEAFILGYEAGARLGMACKLRPTMHMHGTWGTIGAAAAVGRLSGLDGGQMAELLNVASSLSLATSKKTMLQGGLVRNAYAGVSNQMGLLALDLVQSGFSGEHDGIASVFGQVVSESFDPGVMTEDLGRQWQVTRNYFKRHSCCRYNHGALDALEALLAERGPVAVEAVERVEVLSYRDAAEMDDPAPRNTLAARFSVPFAIATRLATGSSDVESFSWAAVRDPAIRALAQRVSVREDPAMTAQLPQHRPARVTLHLTDGSSAAAEVRTNRGDDADPYSRDELSAKFDALFGRAFDGATTAAVKRDVLRLTELDDVRALSRRWLEPALAGA
ncbi:MAG: MmgE/PrpD family protein [Phenylobacterium sp.]